MGQESKAVSRPRKKKPGGGEKGRGRPTLEQSRELDEIITATALEIFLEQGYEATTMESIAEAAGITKRTLYKRYSDKAQLFAAAMRKARGEWTAPDLASSDPAGATLEEEMLSLGFALLEQALNPRTVKLARIASAQAIQFPQEITMSYDISLSPRIDAVLAVLRRYESELLADLLAELPVVAESFISIITGIPSRLAGYGKFREAGFESGRVRLAVGIFIRGIRK